MKTNTEQYTKKYFPQTHSIYGMKSGSSQADIPQSAHVQQKQTISLFWVWKKSLQLTKGGLPL
jgi:hypothetical protein